MSHDDQSRFSFAMVDAIAEVLGIVDDGPTQQAVELLASIRCDLSTLPLS